MGVEFWSTSFATPEPPLLNLLVELVGNYPLMLLVTQKTVRSFPPRPPAPVFLRLAPVSSNADYSLLLPSTGATRVSAASHTDGRRLPTPPVVGAPPGHRQSEPRRRQSERERAVRADEAGRARHQHRHPRPDRGPRWPPRRGGRADLPLPVEATPGSARHQHRHPPPATEQGFFFQF